MSSSWSLYSSKLNKRDLLNEESLFFTGNGYLGVRGNFEEGYEASDTSIRGTYINAFHDVVDVTYGEKQYALPDTQQKLLNVIDTQTVSISLADECGEETFSLFSGEVLAYERKLHVDQGFTERLVYWRSPAGKEIRLHFKRLVSFEIKEIFVQEITIEPVNFYGEVRMISRLNGDVANFIDKHDPRVASEHAVRLNVCDMQAQDDLAAIEVETYRSGLKAACAVRHTLSAPHKYNQTQSKSAVEFSFVFILQKPVVFTKKNVYTDTLRHGTHPLWKAVELQIGWAELTFASLLRQQTAYLSAFWKATDIQIGGNEELQRKMRFNLYHLLQSAGRDRYSNIAAKGLSGEGYEGHYFWDTEIFMFPMFLFSQPQLARSFLLYRYSILDQARAHALQLGHRQGALFPWRTIAGSECSTFFPAGTAQYHINADIAYSCVQYVQVTGDVDFLQQYGAEILFETARLWIDTGHVDQGKFKIHDVTGPDEYTCIVNNNYYTNVMAKHNLKWAAKAYNMLRAARAGDLQRLEDKIGLREEEVAAWIDAAEMMYLPYDEALGINPQDDSFLQKKVWDFAHTPPNHYPLLLHYHALLLYRHQVCKQADTVLAHLLLEDEQEFAVMKKSFDYYERITTHDSSLSPCVFSIMAAKFGYSDKAAAYFNQVVDVDLANTHGNTKDGLHMANMGGTWMAVTFGFAGMRVKESGLSFQPSIPQDWESYAFPLKYQGRTIKIAVTQREVELKLIDGEPLTLSLYGQPLELAQDQPRRVPLITETL